MSEYPSPVLMRRLADDLIAGSTTGHRLQGAGLLRAAADELEASRAAPAPAGEPPADELAAEYERGRKAGITQVYDAMLAAGEPLDLSATPAVDLLDWLVERRDNTARIAEYKQGPDRAGWLEDSAYFEAARAALAAPADEPVASPQGESLSRSQKLQTAGFSRRPTHKNASGLMLETDAPADEPSAMRAALTRAGHLIAWHFFGECRAYGIGPVPSPADVDAAIRAALAAPAGEPAIHELSGRTADELWWETGRLRSELADLKHAVPAPAGEPADEIERLRAFALAIMEDWPDVGLDGADLQELGIKHGLLELKMPKPTEPCSEGCNCASYFAADEWAEGIECYRLSALVTAQEHETPLQVIEAMRRDEGVDDEFVAEPLATAPANLGQGRRRGVVMTTHDWNWIDLLPIVADREWIERTQGIRDCEGRCPICALVHEISGGLIDEREDAYYAARLLTGTLAGVGNLINAADNRHHLGRPALMLALGMRL